MASAIKRCEYRFRNGKNCPENAYGTSRVLYPTDELPDQSDPALLNGISRIQEMLKGGSPLAMLFKPTSISYVPTGIATALQIAPHHGVK